MIRLPATGPATTYMKSLGQTACFVEKALNYKRVNIATAEIQYVRYR